MQEPQRSIPSCSVLVACSNGSVCIIGNLASNNSLSDGGQASAADSLDEKWDCLAVQLSPWTLSPRVHRVSKLHIPHRHLLWRSPLAEGCLPFVSRYLETTSTRCHSAQPDLEARAKLFVIHFGTAWCGGTCHASCELRPSVCRHNAHPSVEARATHLVIRSGAAQRGGTCHASCECDQDSPVWRHVPRFL